MDVVLYTRSGCHLCDEARQALAEAGLHPRLVDVDSRSELVTQFGQCVPVVTIDGRVRFRGQVHPVLLRRLVEAAPGRPSASASGRP
jgi:glutaredoxin